MLSRILIIPGRTYACGCDIQPGRAVCRVHNVRTATDLTFTLETDGPKADHWRVSINSGRAREWCATASNECFETHIAHRRVGDVVQRAARAGLYVRCD